MYTSKPILEVAKMKMKMKVIYRICPEGLIKSSIACFHSSISTWPFPCTKYSLESVYILKQKLFLFEYETTEVLVRTMIPLGFLRFWM